MSDQHPDSFFINPDLVQQLLQQLQKDFVHSDLLKSADPASINGNQVYELVYAEIKELMKRNYSELSNTFYRVDISEKQLKDAMGSNAGKEEAAVITELILKRELQKVVYRNLYKQNKKDDTSA